MNSFAETTTMLIFNVIKAYHDMATFNIEDGTGGLDGSIQFEQDRAEVSINQAYWERGSSR